MTHDSRPTLAHSQNFLTSTRLVDRLLSACSIGPADVVYDIGAGKGMITERLVPRCRWVVAVERDPVLAAHLRHRFSGVPQVTVLGADALSITLPRTPFKFQRTDFAPVPSVETVLLRLRKRGPPLLGPGEAQVYRDFTTYVFTARQPSLQATLAAFFSPRQSARILQDAALSPQATPSSVCFDQWLELFGQFLRSSDPSHRRIIGGAQRRLQVQQARLHKSHRTRANPRYHGHTPRQRPTER